MLSLARQSIERDGELMKAGKKTETTLLVIEPDAVTRSGMKRLLEMYGYRVGAVADKREAAAAARQANYDLILFDTNLPPPESFNAAYQIHKQPELREIPIIAVSVHNQTSVLFDDPNIDNFTVAYLSDISRFDELEKLTAHLLEIKNGKR